MPRSTPHRSAPFNRTIGVAALALALAAGGCLGRKSGDVTGSIGGSGTSSAAMTEADWRAEAERWRSRYERNPGEKQASLGYARALRGLDQQEQAVAVIEKAAIKTPNDQEVLAAYGKALVDAGRYKQAVDVLNRAHSADRPDWRVLSTQGVAYDNLGQHDAAQRNYQAALKLAPGEPGPLSNLGLSLALARKLPEAERVLKQAAADPRADMRVRQNLALVLGLQGKFAEAEALNRRDLSEVDAATNMQVIRRMVAQPNRWDAIKASDKTGTSSVKPAQRAAPKPAARSAPSAAQKPVEG